MWELFEIYVDEGISGTSTKNRNAFNKMMADAKQKKFDYIITKEISRFARNTLDSIYYTRKLKENGIGVIFANDNLFTLDPDAELRLTIMASIAQEESRKTSERVKWGQKRRMEQGVVFGRDMMGYTVRNGKIHIEPEGAQTVKLIFHKYTIEHKGTTTIARELRRAGIPSFNNSNWSNTVIMRMLRNEKYCGDLIQKKTITPDYLTHKKIYNHGEEEMVVIRNHHESIISRELFELTQKEIEARTPNKNNNHTFGKYCFSGKIICAECGSNYVIHTKKAKNGKRYKYWQCYQKHLYGKNRRIDDITGKEIGCFSSQIADEELKQIVMCAFNSIVQKPADYIEIIKSQLNQAFNKHNISPNDEAKRAYNKTLKRRRALIDLYLENSISKEEFLQISDKLSDEISRYEKAIDTAPADNEQIVNQSIEECVAYAEEILSAKVISDELLRHITDKILIDANKNIKIKFNSLPCIWKFEKNNSP